MQQADFNMQLAVIARMTINVNEIRRDFLEEAKRQETADFEKKMRKIGRKRLRLLAELLENTNSPMREEGRRAERDFAREYPDGNWRARREENQ